MKWVKNIKNWFVRVIFGILKVMTLNLPIDKQTGLIDSLRIKNVCLHFDGNSYYYTALIDGYLTFIAYSNDLKNWLEKSGIAVTDLSAIWEMDIPPDVTLLPCENLPVTVVKSRFGFKK
jgi:hypothetical protein